MNKSNKPRYCKICGKQINHLHFNCKTCESDDCKKKWKQVKYSSYNKTCKLCGKSFIGTYHQVYCNDCRQLHNVHSLHKITTKVIKQIICPRCGKVMGQKEVIQTRSGLTVKSHRLCKDCSKKSKQDIKQRMTLSNPMKNVETVKKVSDTREKQYIDSCIKDGKTPDIKKRREDLKRARENKLLSPEEKRRRLSEKMRTNNPMKNPEVVKKARETIERKIKSGEIKIKRGKDRYNYKGGQLINKAVRIRLKEWRKRELKISQYKCERCGKVGGHLHVHHLMPLSLIINEFLKLHKITRSEINNQKDSELFNQIVEEIVDYHMKSLNIGIVLCESCHSKLDKNYYENKKHKN